MTQNNVALLIKINEKSTSCCRLAATNYLLLFEQASCAFLVFPAAGAAGNEPIVPPLTRPALPVWRMRLREAGQRKRREGEGEAGSLLVQLSGRIPAHRQGRGSTGNPNVSQLGWRRGSLRCLGVRAAHVRRSQLLSPGCCCLFP